MTIGDPGPQPGSRILRETFFDPLGNVVETIAEAATIEVEVELRDGTVERTYLTRTA